MVNAWSLAYDVINGTLDENFPIMTDDTRVTPQESDEYDPPKQKQLRIVSIVSMMKQNNHLLNCMI